MNGLRKQHVHTSRLPVPDLLRDFANQLDCKQGRHQDERVLNKMEYQQLEAKSQVAGPAAYWREWGAQFVMSKNPVGGSVSEPIGLLPLA